MASKVELVRLVLQDVLRVYITEAEAEKVIERIEELHEKEAVEHSMHRTATPVKAKVTCSNGHIRVVEGRNWDTACPECGVQTYEYDSRFGGL